MTLLIDRMRGGRIAFHSDNASDWAETTNRILRCVFHYGMPVITAQNVYDYLVANAVVGKSYDKTFPMCAIPPFTEFWLEFDYAPGERVGLAVAFEIEESDDSWDGCILIYAAKGSEISGPQGFHQFRLAADGSWDGKARLESTEIDCGRSPLAVFTVISTLLLTLTFLNCKNVIVTDNEGRHANRQERRAAERRNDPPLVTYKTLQIEPMKKVIETEGDIAKNGLAKALHICRGHFAEYGDEYGKGKLFGKLEGRYYVPAHVRGKAENGVVHKRYNVKAPKGEAA